MREPITQPLTPVTHDLGAFQVRRCSWFIRSHQRLDFVPSVSQRLV